MAMTIECEIDSTGAVYCVQPSESKRPELTTVDVEDLIGFHREYWDLTQQMENLDLSSRHDWEPWMDLADERNSFQSYLSEANEYLFVDHGQATTEDELRANPFRAVVGRWEWVERKEFEAREERKRQQSWLRRHKQIMWERCQFPGDSKAGITNEKTDGWQASEDGEKPPPASLKEIVTAMRERFHDWPSTINGDLAFVLEGGRRIDFLKDQHAFYGWLANFGQIDWRTGVGFVPKAEFFAEWQRQTKRYVAVETLPHEPAFDGHFYCHPSLPEPTGNALAWLLGRFSPETDADRQLILAMFLTVLWGGPCGARPAFLITADSGCGAGKSKLAQAAAALAGEGSALDFVSNEDPKEIKERLLTPTALTARIAFLDNVKSHRFSWAFLESLITAKDVSGKRLFCGEASRPNTLTWIITLNGASLSTDLAQRVVNIKLAKPTHDPSWEPETFQFIEDHRWEIVADLIEVLRRDPKEIADATRWGNWEREVLSKVVDPQGCLAAIVDRRQESDIQDEETDSIRDTFVHELEGHYCGLDYCAVFIPSAVATEWYNRATGDKQKIVTVGRILQQMIKEGRLPQLVKDRNPKSGHRGFKWFGKDVDQSEVPLYDLTCRLSQKEPE